MMKKIVKRVIKLQNKADEIDKEENFLASKNDEIMKKRVNVFLAST